MLAKSVSALAVFAFVAQASASEPVPYKPIMKMSVHDMFGVSRRQDPGYQPTQDVCGTGATCAEACGAGYQTCKSNDAAIHCFNPTASETCCPDGTGNSCDAGYYCTQDKKAQTWCCPNAMNLQACAAAFGIADGLSSETPVATSSAPASTITSAPSGLNDTVTVAITNTTTVPCSTTIGGSATYPSSNVTATKSATASSTPSRVTTSGAHLVAPASALGLFAAAALAALL